VFNAFETFLLSLILLYILHDILLYIIFNDIPNSLDLKQNDKNLSVIIASKNEAHNLKKHLPFILNQNHLNFEVIIIDDQSVDDTFDIIQNLKQYYTNLHYFKIDVTEKSSKKNALTLGIEKAKHEHLVFTDADCKPMTNSWLTEIQKYYYSNNSIILGYSPYRKTSGWLNKLIRYETFLTALNYFSLANLGYAYMGVGRNLGYTKSIFNDIGKFNAHADVLSGDDDLFINSASGQYPIYCCLNPNTYVESEPKENLKAWVDQKRRHITTASYYKTKHKLFLGFQFVLKFSYWFLVVPASIVLMFLDQFYFIGLASIALILKLLISKSLYNKLIVNDIWLSSFILEFQLICLQLYIFSLNLISSKKQW
jgi:glycosyltransferase involved in cell wall biosynthesis